MQLSIIIVNFNVKYFLEQCLYSVEKAISNIDAEVWVVDNASNDGSVEFLEKQFPWVKIIANKINAGFGKANNQALKLSSGKYVLFLNPDTILPENCLEKCLAFMDSHSKAGALGIRMIDGSGIFLPESKRSFPDPFTSFFKLVGLSSLFPKSKLFGKYSLGYLDQHKNHEVDVLAGAFIFGRADLLKKLDGFDEQFFMYGEDVDLSYRVQKEGYKNYYFSESSIIHFKGESTKKGSLNYVRMFYQAMSIFVKKHYGGSRAKIFTFFIQVAIWLRAIFSAISGFFLKMGMPLIDAVLIFCSLLFVNYIWVETVREGLDFNTQLVNIALPGFTLIFLISATLAGIYDNKYKPYKALYSALVAIIVMLAAYSMLPEKYRFSRGVIFFGGVMASVSITLFRWLLLRFNLVEEKDETKKSKQTIIVGTNDEYNETYNILEQAGLSHRIIGRVAANGKKENALGSLSELKTLVESIEVKELILCSGKLNYLTIIQLLQELPENLRVRFHAFGSQSIVGSDSKDSSGEFVSEDSNFQINEAYQRRMKRLVDFGVSFILLITFPIHLFTIGATFFLNALQVLIGKKTWIGYFKQDNKLPLLQPAVITASGEIPGEKNNVNKSFAQIDYWYAMQYDWKHDLKLLIKHYKKLGAAGR